MHVTLYSGLNYTGIHVKQYGPVDDYNMQVQIVFKYLYSPIKVYVFWNIVDIIQ